MLERLDAEIEILEAKIISVYSAMQPKVIAYLGKKLNMLGLPNDLIDPESIKTMFLEEKFGHENQQIFHKFFMSLKPSDIKSQSVLLTFIKYSEMHKIFQCLDANEPVESMFRLKNLLNEEPLIEAKLSTQRKGLHFFKGTDGLLIIKMIQSAFESLVQHEAKVFLQVAYMDKKGLVNDNVRSTSDASPRAHRSSN